MASGEAMELEPGSLGARRTLAEAYRLAEASAHARRWQAAAAQPVVARRRPNWLRIFSGLVAARPAIQVGFLAAT